MNDTFICDHCGGTYPVEFRTLVEDDELCIDCVEDYTIVCSECGARIYTDNNAGDGNTPLCSNCYERWYTTCDRCGRVVYENESHYDDDSDACYCDDCYRGNHAQVIHNYYYKPEPIFYGEGPMYIGVELEIDEGGENQDNAREILSVANSDGAEHIYAKHDGSLNNGFELVSAPCNYKYHYTKMPWRDVLEKAKKLGYVSHVASTCGLHTHVSRDAFGDTVEEQEKCIARILYFFEKHWKELLKFSRRTPRQLERWAARYGYKDRPMDILDQAKKGNNGRYTCVNLENANTIEFRIFRGTLKYNTFIATLQLVDKICSVAICLSDEELKAVSWSSFVAGISKDTYPELVQYLKERNLYINEAVNVEEEV